MTTDREHNPYQQEILALMLKQESLLAKLYQIFAKKFPVHEKLWNKLAREEEKHAGWVEQLRVASEKKVVLFSESRIKPHTLETFVHGIKEKIKQAETDGFDARQALVCTIDLERCLIEKNVFSHFEGLTEKASSTMQFLAKETREHQELAQNLYAKTIGNRASE
ncbi:MAG: ferritin family protein [Desulfurivibrionaceae bacterium]|jgi:rubrerythrin